MRRRLHLGKHEIELVDHIRARGVSATPQLAIGPYNVDIGMAEGCIAVEVVVGSHALRTWARRAVWDVVVRDAGVVHAFG